MKKALYIFFAGVLLFLICAVVLYAASAVELGPSSIRVNEKNATLSSPYSSVKILQLTDIQLTTVSDADRAFPIVEEMIKKTSPDLIVLTGDNVADGSSREVVDLLINFFDGFKIPWALVFGNHDHNSAVSMDEFSSLLSESEYSIFKTGALSDRYGNYYYNLNLGMRCVRTLIFMDSEKSAFTKEQIEWYRDTVNTVTEERGRVVPSFVFFHIPIVETVAAHAEYEKTPAIGSGVMREDVCEQDGNSGFFDAAKSLGSTDALFYGHDHVNNTIIEYDGITFCYGLKTGKNSYYDDDLQGANLITVTKNGYTVDRIYAESAKNAQNTN